MKKIYIIKHYWDENTYGATIAPNWVFSKDNLNQEELKIREIITYYTGLSKYNELSTKKPSFEKYQDEYIYFCYNDKDDPDPTNNRKVTDITFIISSKKLSNPCKLADKGKFVISNNNSLLFSIIVIILGVLFLFTNYNIDNNKAPITKKEIIKDENKTKISIKTISSKKILSKKDEKVIICQKYKTLYQETTKCYQKFLYNVCKNNYKNSYNQWLQQDTNCKKIVGNIKNDRDLKKVSNELKKFIKRYPNE